MLSDQQTHIAPLKVGIVVPYFENREFLISLIESILAQDNDSWRMVIIDDSGCLRPLDLPSYISLDERIEVTINQLNEGIGESWNSGVAQIITKHEPEILCVIHADDGLEQNYISTVIAAHSKFPDAYAVHTGVKIIGKSGSYKYSFPDFVKRIIRPKSNENGLISEGDSGLAQILGGDFIFCPALSFKSKLCKYPLFDSNWKMVIDLNLIATALIAGKKFVGIEQRVYRYRRHSGNLTARLNASTERFAEEVQFYRHIAAVCDQNGFSKSSRVARSMRMIKLHILYQMTMSVLTGNIGLVKKLSVALKDSFRGSR